MRSRPSKRSSLREARARVRNWLLATNAGGDALTLAIYALAALAEIAGCFALWAWARANASALWLIPGIACLVLFAWLLTRVEADYAGRAYAAYGGIYIVASLVWLWLVESRLPDRWDIAGAALSLAGAALIIYGPRGG